MQFTPIVLPIRTGVKIRHMFSFHESINETSFKEWLDAIRESNRLSPAKEESPDVLVATLDAGRWIVHCPECSSALMVSASLQHACHSCADTSWRSVELPNRVDVERILERVPAREQYYKDGDDLVELAKFAEGYE